jgi:hypothetical protein
MKVGEYLKNYSNGEPIRFHEVLIEVKEFFDEVWKLNTAGIREEFQDVLHFFQIWFYWKFGVNRELWKSTSGSVKKFMDRKKVWGEIYVHCGLKENISNFCGNCARAHKVVKHLSKFGISEEKSLEAYEVVIKKREQGIIESDKIKSK